MNIVEYTEIDKNLVNKLRHLLSSDSQFGFNIPSVLNNAKIIVLYQNGIGEAFAYVSYFKNQYEITTLFVSKNSRGQGFGSVLINYIDFKHNQLMPTCIPLELNCLNKMFLRRF